MLRRSKRYTLPRHPSFFLFIHIFHPRLLLFADFRWRSANLTYLLNATSVWLSVCYKFSVWYMHVCDWIQLAVIDITVCHHVSSLLCRSLSWPHCFLLTFSVRLWSGCCNSKVRLKWSHIYLFEAVIFFYPPCNNGVAATHVCVFLLLVMCLGNNFKEKRIVKCHKRNNCIATGLWQVWGWCGWSVELWSADKWLDQKWSKSKASKRDHFQFNQPPYYHHSSKNVSLWRWLTLIYGLIFGFFCQSHVHSCSSFHICTFLSSDNTIIL